MMKKEITLRQATPRDTDTVTDLALLLWPGHGREALRQEMEAFCTREDAAAFLASADDVPVGFAACALRWEYVEGTEQSPAGYLEGIFVAAAFRRCGAAAGLLRRCEAWAKEKDVRSSPATVSWKTRKADCSMPHAAFRKSAEPSISPSGLPRLGCKKPSHKRGGP